MKPKFKIGQVVKSAASQEPDFYVRKICAINTELDGISYGVEGARAGVFIPEDQIEALTPQERIDYCLHAE